METGFDITNERRVVADLEARRRILKQAYKERKAKLESHQQELENTQAAQECLQLVAQAVQQKAHDRIAEVVSTCLATVFEDPYEFHIDFERKRGRTEASLRFSRRGINADPLTASGGGMIDVAAFALRVACMTLHRPRLTSLLVIDEGFKFVSSQYRQNVRTMLEKLSQELHVQIVQVTHIEELETGKVIQL